MDSTRLSSDEDVAHLGEGKAVEIDRFHRKAVRRLHRDDGAWPRGEALYKVGKREDAAIEL